MQPISIPTILLPEKQDMCRWAVNACDQFTSDGKYWEELYSFVGDKPSALNLIYPEIYLKDNPEKRIADINAAMRQYLAKGIFKEVSGGFVLVERTTKSGVRRGILLAVDLEEYDYRAGTSALIRSTEATILERIPPRVEIRRNAPIELPHVMLLYNDKRNVVLNSVACGETLYDFELNMGGGRIKGTYIKNAEAVKNTFYKLMEETAYVGGQKLLFAVGDGNHSLATAKTCWENIKPTLSEEEKKSHPARFALAEAVNIYDDALKFEPIFRFVKTEHTKEFVGGLSLCGGKKAYVVCGGKKSEIPFPDDVPEGIRILDEYIAAFIKKYGGEVDYIHGEEELIALTSAGVGVLLPPIAKDDFFRLIVEGGNLPRKTFSMGEGNEKRYYIEAKKIK